jgi:hypothetical protein
MTDEKHCSVCHSMGYDCRDDYHRCCVKIKQLKEGKCLNCNELVDRPFLVCKSCLSELSKDFGGD